MNRTAVQLERRDGHEGVRAYLLLEADGSIAGVVGPHVSCAIGAERCKEALIESGYAEDEFAVGPVIVVSAETMEMYIRGWGRDSRHDIVRRARQLCGEQGRLLSTEASTERFDGSGDRELAAALWFLWLDGESVGAVLGNCTPDDSFPKHEACQIGAFVAYIDGEGRVTFDEFPTAAAAEQRVLQIGVWQSVDGPKPKLAFLAEPEGLGQTEQS